MLPRVLSTARGLEVHILPLGATVQRLYVPDSQGKRADVALGFSDWEMYKNATADPYFGATVGRCDSSSMALKAACLAYKVAVLQGGEPHQGRGVHP